MNNDLMFASGNDVTGTPWEFFNKVAMRAGGFVADMAALATNTKVPGSYYGPDHVDPTRRDCLTVDWPTHGPVWLNPPYSKRKGTTPGCVDFVAKASLEHLRGAEIWALLASRTDNAWFHTYLWNEFAETWRRGIHGIFLRGRLTFEGHTDSAPFPSLLVRFIPERLL